MVIVIKPLVLVPSEKLAHQASTYCHCQNLVTKVTKEECCYNVAPVGIEITNSFLISESFTLNCNLNIFKVEKLVKDKLNNGCVITKMNQMRAFKQMKLTCEANCIQTTPNAGGSSVESETLSFEILKKLYNAQLLKTEMEVQYFPNGGSVTDYVVYLFDSVIGVSVTRAFKYNEEPFTHEDAFILLKKKLNGILQSTRNTMVRWDKQILHVWVLNDQAADSLLNAWSNMDQSLRSNTVLLITLAKNSKEIFTNPQKKIKRRLRNTVTTKILNITS